MAIAAVLAMRPAHLILDEPVAELDPDGTTRVVAALRALSGAGTTLLIAEHRTDVLAGLCTRIVAIDGGRVVLDAPTARALADPILDRIRRPHAARCGPPVIRCEGVAYAYPSGARALDGIDLEIGFRERVAIVGPNGSGKSTLAQLWNGLLRPTAASSGSTGIPTTGRRVADLSRTVGIAFQDADRQLFARTLSRRGGLRRPERGAARQ